MPILWDRGTTSGVRRGKMISLLKNKNLMDKFIEQEWPSGSTNQALVKNKWFLKVAEEYDQFLSTGHYSTTELIEPFDSDDNLETAEPKETMEFALESHLRDFIAKHLNKIEPGLSLYKSEHKNGIEFLIDAGRIDILAIDKNNKFVVIELKLSQGRNKTLGQILYYMSWVDENLRNGPCRGIIIASEISDELAMAVSRVPGVSLVKYIMSFDLEVVRQII